MKPTVKRLKTILAANYSYFAISVVVTSIAYALYGVFALSDWFMTKPKITSTWSAIFVGLVIFLPVIARVEMYIHTSMNAITDSIINVSAAKRNIFINIGVLWASLGALSVACIVDNIEFIAFVAAAATLLSFRQLLKLVLKYVYSV